MARPRAAGILIIKFRFIASDLNQIYPGNFISLTWPGTTGMARHSIIILFFRSILFAFLPKKDLNNMHPDSGKFPSMADAHFFVRELNLLVRNNRVTSGALELRRSTDDKTSLS